jgi:hypothetical protein
MTDQPEPTSTSSEAPSARTPLLIRETSKDTGTFTVCIGLPYLAGDPNCCTKYQVEIWTDEYDNAYATHRHADDCEVWRFVP